MAAHANAASLYAKLAAIQPNQTIYLDGTLIQAGPQNSPIVYFWTQPGTTVVSNFQPIPTLN